VVGLEQIPEFQGSAASPPAMPQHRYIQPLGGFLEQLGKVQGAPALVHPVGGHQQAGLGVLQALAQGLAAESGGNRHMHRANAGTGQKGQGHL